MSAVLLEPDKYRKAVGAAALLSSDKGGEVVAALAAIERLLPKGIRIGDVFAAGLRPDYGWILDGNHQEQASWALAEGGLTDWERNFCQSVFHFRNPSPRQLKTLRDICERELAKAGEQ